jgi:RNA polymerase sigma factor (sigma-70 family)
MVLWNRATGPVVARGSHFFRFAFFLYTTARISADLCEGLPGTEIVRMTNLDTRSVSQVGGVEALADAELLSLWCSGRSAGALEVLVRRHGGMVLGVCRRVLGNTADADDAFQATFLIFVQKAQSLSRPERVAGWLHAVALRVARKARASRARRREREAVNVDTVDPADTVNVDPAGDQQVLRRTIDEELDRLPEKYRLPIVMCELEGRSLEEAAQLLGWPKGTVAGRLSRGRELLRQRLTRRGVGLPLFLVVPVPAVEALVPPEPLVSATLSTATADGSAVASAATELARAVLRDGVRRRFGLLALLLISAALLVALGLFTVPALVRLNSSPPPPAVQGGCHTPTS